jgi:cation diffusion facilitator CzcD-associated flavoprotein CzcO
MPEGPDRYPTRDEAIAYLTEYERRYALPVERPVRVDGAYPEGDTIRLATSSGEIVARDVISATGIWRAPQWPVIDGDTGFGGTRIHSATYPGPAAFEGQRVLVVGGGNSGAQVFADLVGHADVSWVTREPPNFLPDDVDGQFLFEQGTARFKALQEGRAPDLPRSLGDVVMVASVRAIRERGLLVHRPMFTRFTRDGVVWPEGQVERIDAVIFATGFKPALSHLAPLLTPDEKGRIPMDGAHAASHAHVWPLGYGDWTGFASATLIGSGRAAKRIVEEIGAKV